MAFIEALKVEIDTLEKEIAADPRLVKLRELKRVKELYEGANPNAGAGLISKQSYLNPFLKFQENALAAASTINSALVDHGSARTPGRKPSPERLRALEEAAKFVREAGAPVKTADIYSHIQSLGIPIGGDDPQNNLSAMLNKSSQFISHGRVGWTLAEGGIFE